jgi:hypothetical protein
LNDFYEGVILNHGNHKNQMNHSSDNMHHSSDNVQTRKSFCMQNNKYHEWLVYSCDLMEQTIYWLFCSAMDLSFTGELKDVLHPGETVELSSDILLAMEDPLIQRIGNTVEESIQLLNSLKNINDLADTATHNLLHDADDASEATAIAAKELSYDEQVNVIAEYLKNAMLEMLHVIWELSAHNEKYALVNITDVTTSNVYLDGDDANIALMSAFVKGVGELRKVISSE